MKVRFLPSQPGRSIDSSDDEMVAKTSAAAWRLGTRARGSKALARYGTDLEGWGLVGPGTPRVASWSDALLARCRELRPGWYLNRVIVRYAEGRARVRLDGRARSGAPESCLDGSERVARLRARLQGRPVDLEIVDLGVDGEGEGWEADLSQALQIASQWPSAGRLATVRAEARVEVGDRLVLRKLTQLLESSTASFRGYRIEVRGRLRGADRADNWVYEGGELGRSSISAGVSSGRASAVLKYGTYGVAVFTRV